MHNIQDSDKQEGFTQAWHGLTAIRPDLSIDHNWLAEWDVISKPLFMMNGSGTPVTLPFEQLVASDKTHLLIGQPYNPETYRPITNAEFLKLVRDSISGTDHKVVSVGSVRNRARVFVSVEMVALGAFTAGGRKFDPYLNFGNGHDKSSVLWVNTSNICTVCDNTFSANLFSVEKGSASSNSLRVSQRHTKNVALRLPEISDIVDKAVGVQREFANAFESLAGKTITTEAATHAFAGFVAAPDVDRLSTRANNTVSRLVGLFQNGRGNHGQTRADLFSAVTDYYTHENAGGRGKAERQMLSSEFGTGASRKQNFFAIVQDDERLGKMIARGAEVLA